MEQKEIGGYFGLESLVSKEYYPNLIALNNARNALLYLLKARNIKKLYIPYFLCDSVSKLCDKHNYAYECYHIDDNFMPVFDKQLFDNEYLYIVNYYGQVTNNKILKLQTKYKNIIVDNVQAFFQKPIKNIDTIYSCRKFFGVPDGAYLSTSKKLLDELPLDLSKDRMKHILGRYEEKKASLYYSDFKANDASFTELELKQMSLITHNILGAIDYKKVIKARNENYKILRKALKDTNKLKLTTPYAPYCYPYYCENGMEIKRKLAEKKIYVPTLWPNVLEFEGSLEKDFAENILPLPCDQRYTPQDMKKLISLLTQLTEMIKCTKI